MDSFKVGNIIISAYGLTCEDFLQNHSNETKFPRVYVKKGMKSSYPNAILIVGGDLNARVGKSNEKDEVDDIRGN